MISQPHVSATYDTGFFLVAESPPEVYSCGCPGAQKVHTYCRIGSVMTVMTRKSAESTNLKCGQKRSAQLWNHQPPSDAGGRQRTDPGHPSVPTNSRSCRPTSPGCTRPSRCPPHTSPGLLCLPHRLLLRLSYFRCLSHLPLSTLASSLQISSPVSLKTCVRHTCCYTTPLVAL